MVIGTTSNKQRPERHRDLNGASLRISSSARMSSSDNQCFAEQAARVVGGNAKGIATFIVLAHVVVQQTTGPSALIFGALEDLITVQTGAAEAAGCGL